MKTYILVYEEFAHFEVILASYLLRIKGEIVTVGINENTVTSAEGFQIMPHIKLEDVCIEDVDIFIIPGGDPYKIEGAKSLTKLIAELNSVNRIIGAICGGVVHLAKANILNGKTYTTSLELDEYKEFDECGYQNMNVVVDGNIITAKATGYADRNW